MNELALFAGAGGGILGGLLHGWRTVAAVEIEDYPRRVLLQRQADGILPRFPIWDDVTNFDGKPWRGRVDIITGGFPCQPFSSAARGRNNAWDGWPEMRRIIREVRPRFVFAENVKREPIERAAFDLLGAGYSSRFIEVGMDAAGAPIKGDRWWLLAEADSESKPGRAVDAEVAGVPQFPSDVWGWSDIPRRLPMDDGDTARVDQLKAIGNMQNPAVAALAWSILSRDIDNQMPKE